MQIELNDVSSVLTGWIDLTGSAKDRKNHFLGKNNNPTPEKFLLVLDLAFGINDFEELCFEELCATRTQPETISQIRGAMVALGAERLGGVNDGTMYVLGLIAAKAFPEMVPEIVEQLGDNSPTSRKQQAGRQLMSDFSTAKKDKEKKVIS